MKSFRRSLRWGLLYLTLPLMGGLFYAEARVPLSALGHTVLQLLILLLVFGLIWLWCAISPLPLADDALAAPDTDHLGLADLTDDRRAFGLPLSRGARDFSAWMSPAEEVYDRVDLAGWEGDDPKPQQPVSVGEPELIRWTEWRN